MKNSHKILTLSGILLLALTLYIVFAFLNVSQTFKVYVNGDPSYTLYYQEDDSMLTQDLVSNIEEDDAPLTYGILPEHLQRQLLLINVETIAFQQTNEVFPVQTGLVDLQENKVTVEGKDYFYTEENGHFEIAEAEGDTSEYNLLQMVRLGHRDRSQNISEVVSTLISHLWKPILLIALSSLLLLKSRQAANVIVNLFIKNAEPSDFFIGLVAFNGLILLGLALFLLYQIWVSFPH